MFPADQILKPNQFLGHGIHLWQVAYLDILSSKGLRSSLSVSSRALDASLIEEWKNS